MGMKSCFFIGHREANERVLPALEQAVEQLIVESGVESHQKKFIRHCMRLLSSTLLNMASQNFSSVTMVDLTALQR